MPLKNLFLIFLRDANARIGNYEVNKEVFIRGLSHFT